MTKEEMTADDLLKKIEKMPDGFAKAWFYLVYGAMKGAEVGAKAYFHARDKKK